MSIEGRDISGLRGSKEQFLYSSMLMSDRVLKRLNDEPAQIFAALYRVKNLYMERIKHDENAIRTFSPLRATALYLDFLCHDPLLDASQKRDNDLRKDMVDFASGIRHMSVSLLRGEGGKIRGVEEQALSELNQEAMFMVPENRELYVDTHKGARVAEVKRQVGFYAESQKSDPPSEPGMFLMKAELANMSNMSEPLVIHGKTVMVDRWSPASRGGAEFARSVYEAVHPFAEHMFQADKPK